jgi:hypothetical protein
MRWAKYGCGAVAEPVACVKKAADSGSSPAAVGVATKCETRTTNLSRLSIALRGVITSSSPSGRNEAERPSTDTEPTLVPPKSRLKRESDCVARARIVTVPSIDCDGALVA